MDRLDRKFVGLGPGKIGVSCADLQDVVVEAESYEEAFRKAIEQHNPESLAEIVMFKKLGEEARWSSTMWLLKEFGLWSDEKDIDQTLEIHRKMVEDVIPRKKQY